MNRARWMAARGALHHGVNAAPLHSPTGADSQTHMRKVEKRGTFGSSLAQTSRRLTYFLHHYHNIELLQYKGELAVQDT